MRPRPSCARGLALALGSALLLSSTGCVTAERRANRHLNRIAVGMTREEVERELGEPDSLVERSGGETWHYSYGSRPDPGKIATLAGQWLAVLTVFGIVFLPILYAGARAGRTIEPDFDKLGPRGDRSTDSDTVHFHVIFDRTGRVKSVSGIEPCDED